MGGGAVMVRALRGPEVSRGVWEMTAVLLGGPNPFINLNPCAQPHRNRG